MNRFIYWVKTKFDKEEMKCSHFCVTCKYFDRCQQDTNIARLDESAKRLSNHKNKYIKKAS